MMSQLNLIMTHAVVFVARGYHLDKRTPAWVGNAAGISAHTCITLILDSVDACAPLSLGRCIFFRLESDYIHVVSPKEAVSCMSEVVNNPVFIEGENIPMTFALPVINRLWFDTIKNKNMATNQKHPQRWYKTVFNHVDHYLSAFREFSKQAALAHSKRIPLLSTGTPVTWPVLQLDSTNHSWDVSNPPSP